MKRTDPRQEELPLSSLNVSDIFCGRKSLYLGEVKKILGCTLQHVINLIEEFHETNGRSGLEGFSIANAAGNVSGRQAWRVPVDGLQKFLNSRTAGTTAVATTTKP